MELEDDILKQAKNIEDQTISSSKTAAAFGQTNTQAQKTAEDLNVDYSKESAPLRFGLGVAAGSFELLKTGAEVVKDVYSELTNDEDPDTYFDPSKNEKQKQLFESFVAKYKLEPNDPIYVNAYAAKSEQDFEYIVNKTEELISDSSRLQELGYAGSTGAFLGNLVFDVDTFVPSLKVNKILQVRHLKKLQDSGQIPEDIAKLVKTRIGLPETKTQSIAKTTTELTTFNLTANQVQSEYDPSLDETDTLTSLITSIGLGTVIGSVSPTQKSIKIPDNLSGVDLQKQKIENIVEAVRQEKEAQDFNKYNKALRFIAKSEGKSNRGLLSRFFDKGKETNRGISSKYYPNQFKELEHIEKEQGQKAADEYANRFYKEEFVDKLDTDGLNADQVMVLTDTAVLFGLKRAKQMFLKSNKDPRKLIQLRREAHAKKITKDPSQKTFEKGWENRNKALEAELDKTDTPDQALRKTIDKEDVYSLQNAEKFDTEDPKFKPKIDLDKSVGSAAVDFTGDPNDPRLFIPQTSKEIIQHASDYIEETPDLSSYLISSKSFVDSDNVISQNIQKATDKIYGVISNTWFKTDYDRLFNIPSDVAKMLSHKLLVDPLSRVVNNRSANNISDMIQQEVNTFFTPNAEAHYKTWARDTGVKRSDIIEYEFGARQRFNKELWLYREAINQKREVYDVHSSIKKASDDLDRAYKALFEYNKKYGVEGFENVEYKHGHNSHQWDGNMVAKVSNTAGVGSDNVIQAIKQAIISASPDIPENKAFLYAKAIYRHSLNKQLGSPVGALGTISDDGLIALQRIIMDEGNMTPEDALDIAKSILYQNEERGTAKFTRGRIQLDTSTPINGTDLTVGDLMNNDPYYLAEKSVRTQAHTAALASVGIQHRDIPKYKQAVIDEVNMNGGNAKEAAETFDIMMSYYSDKAFAGGSGVAAHRINKLGRLAYLGQMGLSQLAEFGVTLGVVGIKAYTKFAGKTLKAMWSKTEPDLMKAVIGSNKYVEDAALLYKGQNLDEVNTTVINGAELNSFRDLIKYASQLDGSGNYDVAGKLGTLYDITTDRLSRVMGVITLFNKINQMQQITSVLALQNLVVQSIKNGVDNPRLRSMGIDDEVRDMISRYINAGYIRFDDDGDVIGMGIENWDFPDQELMQLVNRKNMDNAVQKSGRGEGQHWTYTTLGSLFSNLKTFTYVAMHKQFLKNARLADVSSLGVVLYTTLTGGLVYSAKQLLNGNLEDNDATDIAQGALQWSNLGSPYAFFDATSYLLGLSEPSYRDISGGIIGMPAGLSAANSLLNLPKVVTTPLVKNKSLGKVEKDAIAAIPLIRATYLPQIIKNLQED